MTTRLLFAALGAAALLTGAAAPLNAASTAKPVKSAVFDNVATAKVLAKLDDDWSRAAATADAGKVAAFYAQDAIAYPPNAPVAIGHDAAQKVWAGYFADKTFKISWTTTHAEIAKSGDIGYTAGTYEDSFTGPDGKQVHETGKYVCAWKKQKDGTWKAIQDIWNADK